MVSIIKNDLRKKYLELRDNESKEMLLHKSLSIIENLNSLECVKSAKSIMSFVSFRNEVETQTLIKKWIYEGREVSVPFIEKISRNSKLMHAIRISDLSELKSGNFGVLEPSFNLDNIVPPNRLDIVIVPGSVFDEQRNRIGYGGGFYDRYLPATRPNCMKIGISYDFQVVNYIPHEEYDVPLDIIVTESRIIK